MSELSRGHVGVRELRQNLSVYLDRVKAGETLEVTERGRVVARLGPSSAGASAYDRLVEDGSLRLGTRSLVAIGRPPRTRGRRLSDVLREMRDDERS